MREVAQFYSDKKVPLHKVVKIWTAKTDLTRRQILLAAVEVYNKIHDGSLVIKKDRLIVPKVIEVAKRIDANTNTYEAKRERRKQLIVTIIYLLGIILIPSIGYLFLG